MRRRTLRDFVEDYMIVDFAVNGLDGPSGQVASKLVQVFSFIGWGFIYLYTLPTGIVMWASKFESIMEFGLFHSELALLCVPVLICLSKTCHDNRSHGILMYVLLTLCVLMCHSGLSIGDALICGVFLTTPPLVLGRMLCRFRR